MRDSNVTGKTHMSLSKVVNIQSVHVNSRINRTCHIPIFISILLASIYCIIQSISLHIALFDSTGTLVRTHEFLGIHSNVSPDNAVIFMTNDDCMKNDNSIL